MKAEVNFLAPLEGSGSRPMISVVMPTFRRAKDIKLTIESLLEGEFRDFELLVRDDGDQKDGTREAVEDASRGDKRVRYHLNESNLRMPENLNSGLRESRGHYVVVCHDHDLYDKKFLSSMLATLRTYPEAQYVHTAVEFIDQEGVVTGQSIGEWAPLTDGKVWLRRLLKTRSCPVCALVMIPRKSLELHGLLECKFGFIADVEMAMRLCLFGDVAYIREPLVRIRDREKDHFANNYSLPLNRLIAKIHRLYIPLSFPYPIRAFKRLMFEINHYRKIWLLQARRAYLFVSKR